MCQKSLFLDRCHCFIFFCALKVSKKKRKFETEQMPEKPINVKIAIAKMTSFLSLSFPFEICDDLMRKTPFGFQAICHLVDDIDRSSRMGGHNFISRLHVSSHFIVAHLLSFHRKLSKSAQPSKRTRNKRNKNRLREEQNKITMPGM